VIVLAAATLGLTARLAILAFALAFGVGFLGMPRTAEVAVIYAVSRPRGASRRVPVWDGGIVAFKPRMQYTATTFANPVRLTFERRYSPGVHLDRASDDLAGRSGPVHNSRRGSRRLLRCPVRDSQQEVRSMFRRVLVGFDGSASSLQALRVALGVAAQASGEATVLIVIPPTHGETEADRIASFDDDARPLQAMAQQELDAARGEDLTTSLHVVCAEHAAKALVSYADAHGYDLVVVGRHGRERAMHGGLGKVARELADATPCPLLLVGNGHTEFG
jgi:nucleotide-binding universal stress UspA family protein